MSPRFKLLYFNIRGRGEIIRMLLHAAKQDFLDYRWAVKEWYHDRKHKAPYGQCPLFEINGKFYTESVAIQCYLASEFGMYGDTNLDRLQIHRFVQLQEELIVKEVEMFTSGFTQKGAAVTEEFFEFLYTKPGPDMKLLPKFSKSVYPKYLRMYTDLIKENKDGEYCVGNKLSWADIALHANTQTAVNVCPDVLDAFPELKAIRSKVDETPGIKEYLKIRGFHSL